MVYMGEKRNKLWKKILTYEITICCKVQCTYKYCVCYILYISIRYTRIIIIHIIRVCIHVDLWSSEAAGVCRDTRNVLLSPARLCILTVSGPSYNLFLFRFFLFYFIILLYIYYIFNSLLYIRKVYDDKTIDVFRKKKLWATTFFFYLCPLYTQPVSRYFIALIRLALYILIDRRH